MSKLKYILLFVVVLGCGATPRVKTATPVEGSVKKDEPSEPESSSALYVRPQVQRKLSICSFNIQFLGHFKKRDNKAVAGVLRDCDIAVVQELVAPPTDGTYPDGEAYTADEEARAFVDEMSDQGFVYVLSEEDTGTGDTIHKKTSSTEWWVAFYKANAVEVATDLPSGFLADDRSNNDDYERVPYAFAFRTPDNKLSFVLISVHLQPGDKASEAARRKHELETIAAWIDAHDEEEKDFIILGDMNIYTEAELDDVTPAGYKSLNDECRRTNTLINDKSDQGAKPYDHVMYSVSHTTEYIDIGFDMQVIDLVEEMRSQWTGPEPYPGDPYHHNLFKQLYSDHHPVRFQMILSE
ncbi:MAG: hypothetical protein GY847_04645 [Proteobacteria bacterium]|nr:hypothetical protein [Pseudomonadota bacterium]